MPYSRHLTLSSLMALAGVVVAGAALAADPSTPNPAVPPLEVNNQWSVNIGNSIKVNQEWFYVTIRRIDNHWEIQNIYDRAPTLDRSQQVELFAATRDFQRWTNFYLDMRTDCEKFEVRESDKHSVCTSSFAEKKTGLGIAGAFFGGGGKIPFGYIDEKVRAAINSIPMQQAMVKLSAFEGQSQVAQKQSQVAATTQAAQTTQTANDLARARKAAPQGAKYWCEQTVQYYGAGMQVDASFTCKNYGVVDEEILRVEGWAITNKQSRNIGHPPQVVTVYDIAIERVPR